MLVVIVFQELYDHNFTCLDAGTHVPICCGTVFGTTTLQVLGWEER